MVQKEATVYVVDVGKTMRERTSGRTESNMDFALRYVYDKLTTAISGGRKTVLSGVVAVRSEKTNNDLSETPEYHHINVLHGLSQLEMPGLRSLRSSLVACTQMEGDLISALVVAVSMIEATCKKLQYIRRIVLVTDARAAMYTDDLADVATKMKEDGIELAIIGVDFDDAEYGFKEEDKDPRKKENEDILRQLCQDIDGVFGTLAQAVEELAIPRVKEVNPIPSYKGFLTLGDPHKYDDAFNIAVERYPKTMRAMPPSATSFVIRSDLNADTMSGDNLSGIKNTRTYKVDDPDAPSQKREIDPEDLAKGYEYGRTAVHISESDQNVTDFETPQGMDIIGFVDAKAFDRYFEMSRTNMILPAKGSGKDSMALSSLVRALFETDRYAVARLVVKDNKQPLMTLLSWGFEKEFECLYESELPFAEDVRSYRFAPLDRVVTVSGKSITVHRNLPSDDLQKAMSDYVDAMDLSTFGKDEDGKAIEYGPPEETYSPVLHHLNHVIRQRAIYPDRDPPEPAPILRQYANPPDELVDSAKSALTRVITAADVKKVPPKARGKRFGKKEQKPLSELDISALLAVDPRRKQKKIDPRNAIPEFKQLLHNANSVPELHDGCNQLKMIVFDWIRHSVGDSNDGKILEAIKVMKQEMTEFEEPGPFNEFMAELKKKLLAGDLGGDRSELWYAMRIDRGIGLIKKADVAVSTVTDEEAAAFKSAK